MRLLCVVTVLLILSASAGAVAQEWAFDDSEPLTERMISTADELVRREVLAFAKQNQDRLLIEGNVAEICVSSTLSMYGEPAGRKGWPYNVRWNDRSAWKNAVEYHNELLKRVSYDRIAAVLCVYTALPK